LLPYGALPFNFPEEVKMTNYTDNQNYVRAVLADIGIDFDETEIHINVSHCQGDEVSFLQYISQ
jgi:hypothetical protein